MTQPTRVQLSQRIIQVSFGYQHSLFLTSDHQVYGCGKNLNFELGLGFQNDQQEAYSTPVHIQNLQSMQIQKVIAGTFSAAINSENQILVWGLGEFGVIKSPQKLFMDKVEFVDCQMSKYQENDCSALALDSQGKVYSWGKNTHGQLGHGDKRDRKLPTLVLAIKNKEIR